MHLKYVTEKEKKGGRWGRGGDGESKRGEEREKKERERLRIMGLYLCPNGILHMV